MRRFIYLLYIMGVGDDMDSSIFAEIIDILQTGGMKTAMVQEEEGVIGFGTIDPEKIAMIKVVIYDPQAISKDLKVDGRAVIDLTKLKNDSAVLKKENIKIDITPEKTTIISDTQSIEHKNIAPENAPTLYNKKIVFPAKVIAPAEDLKMFLKAANQSVSQFTLSLDPDELKMHSINVDQIETELFLPKDMLHHIDVDKKYVSKYSTSWPWDFVKRVNTERINLEFGTDFPLKISVDTSVYTAELLLAPVVDSD